MKLTGEKPKDKVLSLASMLPVGKSCAVSFGPHKDTAVLESVTLATQSKIKEAGANLPDKRRGANGKDYTPAMVSLQFYSPGYTKVGITTKELQQGFVFDLVLEDIDILMRIGGATITIGPTRIEIDEV